MELLIKQVLMIVNCLEANLINKKIFILLLNFESILASAFYKQPLEKRIYKSILSLVTVFINLYFCVLYLIHDINLLNIDYIYFIMNNFCSYFWLILHSE